MKRLLNSFYRKSGFTERSILLLIFVMVMHTLLSFQCEASPPSRRAELFFKIDSSFSNVKEAKDIVLKNKAVILDKLEQKFPTVFLYVKSGNPDHFFEGTIAEKKAEFNQVDFLFNYMYISEYLSPKVTFPTKNRVFLCSVPMVLKGHSCLLSEDNQILLNHSTDLSSMIKNKTEHATVIYSDHKTNLNGVYALHFWIWIDDKGNIYALPR